LSLYCRHYFRPTSYSAQQTFGHLSLKYKSNLRQNLRVRSSKFPSRDNKNKTCDSKTPVTVNSQPQLIRSTLVLLVCLRPTKHFFFVPLRASSAMVGVGPPRTSGLEVLGLGSAQPRQALRWHWPFALLCLFILYSGHKSRWSGVTPDTARRYIAE